MKNSLTTQETQALIDIYESEIKQMKFKIIKSLEVIDQLKNGLRSGSAVAIPKTKIDISGKVPGRKRGRPRKIVLDDGDPTGPGNPKKLKKKRGPKGKAEKVQLIIPKISTRKTRSGEGNIGGYRLSEWDQFILQTLADTGHVLINSELMDMAFEKSKSEKLNLTQEEVRGKMVRSIHKLANKRGAIIKAPFPGKGFAYGLAAWFTGTGKLKKIYGR